MGTFISNGPEARHSDEALNEPKKPDMSVADATKAQEPAQAQIQEVAKREAYDTINTLAKEGVDGINQDRFRDQFLNNPTFRETILHVLEVGESPAIATSKGKDVAGKLHTVLANPQLGNAFYQKYQASINAEIQWECVQIGLVPNDVKIQSVKIVWANLGWNTEIYVNTGTNITSMVLGATGKVIGRRGVSSNEQ